MAKIYNAPTSVKLPKFSFQNYDQYLLDCEQYYKDLKAYLLNLKKGKHVGEVLRFPVADGEAEYMVASLRPLELIHLPLGDAYEFPYIALFTVKEVNAQITRQKALEALVNRNKDK